MSRRAVVLDTDVASAIFRGRLDPDEAVRLAGTDWAVSFATVGELWKWAEARNWGNAQRTALRRWLDGIPVVDTDDLVARHWGRSVGTAHARGVSRPVNDAWIAACCLAHGLPLATFNVRDFAYHVEQDGLVLVE